MRAVNAQAVGWALEQDLPPHLQHILVVVASMADRNGLAWASHRTIAELMGSTPETVRANVRKLVAEKVIVRYDRFRENGSRTSGITVLLMGQEVDPSDYGWRIGDRTDAAVDVDPLGAALATRGTGGSSPGGAVAGHQSRSVELDQERSDDRSSTDRARVDRPDQVPSDFPDELRPHARSVMALLRDMAVEHGARGVTARAVGRVVMANSRKALVAEAYAMAAYYEGRQVKDVVGTYRNWLKRSDDMAGVERLDERGLPCAPGPRGVVGGGQVRPSGRMSAMDQALANQQEIQRLRAAGEIE